MERTYWFFRKQRSLAPRFSSQEKKPSFIVFFFQLRYSLKTSTCKFVNLSIISYALPEGSAPVPFHPRGTPWDSSTIEDQDYFPSESLYVWKRKGEFC